MSPLPKYPSLRRACALIFATTLPAALTTLLVICTFLDAAHAQSAFRDVEAADQLREEAWYVGQKATDMRPTGPRGPIGLNYGDVSAQYLDAGPAVRIWYVSEGTHAVPLADDDSSGVPDFVERLAQILVEVVANYDDAGWGRPLSDEGRGLPDYGGDGRFDVYLIDFGRSADGLLSTEFCEGDSPSRCGGFIAIENDFVGYNYPSIDEALTVLFSHEYAHAVGAGYASGAATWWDEGQATWAEWAFAGIVEDVVRLSRRWFANPSRSLSDNAAPGDGWAYAGSTFVLHLSEVYGEELILDVWEVLAAGRARGTTPALDVALEDIGATIEGAWEDFVLAAWFVGERAPTGSFVPLQFDERYPEMEGEALTVTSLPFELEVAPFAARYLRLSGLAELSDEVVARPCDEETPVAGALALDEGSEAVADLRAAAVSSITIAERIVVLTGYPRSSDTHCVSLQAPCVDEGCDEEPPVCEDDDCDEEPPACEDADCDEEAPTCEGGACDEEVDGSDAETGCQSTAAPGGGLWILLFLCALACRHRGRTCRDAPPTTCNRAERA